MFMFISKIKSYIALAVMLSVSVFAVKHQRSEIDVQKQLISNLQQNEIKYKNTINRMRTMQRKKNKVFKEYYENQHKINEYFDRLKGTIGKNNEKITWDNKKIPDSVLCFIDCMQRGSENGKCEC